MDAQRRTQVSKFLSLVLRHQPEKIGIRLDANGWVAVDELLNGLAADGLSITRDELQEVVDTSDKQRFALTSDGLCIRANQGHSVNVDLAYEPAIPPEVLYHGTCEQKLVSIKASGLVKGARHHVHLSVDTETARKVGIRHGVPVVLSIRAAEMAKAGYSFYITANGVWLTDQVPVAYLILPE